MIEFYTTQLNLLQTKIDTEQKRSDKFSRIRLLIFVSGCILGYLAFTHSITLGIVTVVLFLSALIIATLYHQKIDRNILYLSRLKNIYSNELNIKEKNIFGNGKQYIDDIHPYTSDLDIFGENSLFAYINRTVTKEGSDQLAGFLKTKSTIDEIKKRQDAFAEISQKKDFKEHFLSAFFLSKSSSEEESGQIHEFICNFKPSFLKPKLIKFCITFFPLLLLFSFILGFFWSAIWGVSILAVLVNLFITFKNNSIVDNIDYYVGKYANVFYKYSELMKVIKSETFTNPLLQDIKEAIVSRYKFDNELVKLSGLSQKLDYRKNMLIVVILNALFLWDIRIAYNIECWFKHNKDIFAKCLDEIGRMDAYLSMGISYFNHPQWVLPEISNNYFSMEGKSVAHPLIPAEKRIGNDFCLDGTGKVVIITGSNMAGKSTFLRTLGVNMVLAFAGGKVCADSLKVSLSDIHTYMRIRDSLNENTSSFYAELLRIKSIISEIEKNKHCFLLLDELLRGTNSKDKYIGSVAIVKNLIKNNTVALVATHDLELTKMQEDFPDNITNYHFDISVCDEEFYFDYKLCKGICHNFNACLLMKKIGIEVEEEKAQNKP